MKASGKQTTSLWLENKNQINIIDQTQLPFKTAIINLRNTSDFCEAITKMKVRGAPLIGVTAAFGLALAIKQNPKKKNIEKYYEKLLKTRPTAINLKWALDEVKNKVLNYNENRRAEEAIKIAKNIRTKDIESCKKIGLYGFKIIEKLFKKKKKVINILTHCNAGWLAAIDWGTAIAPIYMAKRKKIHVHIWVDETRPRNQGALLTAWELEQEKIPYTIIVDNAGGYLMQEGKVDLCIVGSDRTAMNGDVCNKIGTYLKAISAYQNKIPFFVALPTSTIDPKSQSGKDIPIEERDPREITHFKSLNKSKLIENKIYFNCKNISNPAFDITPSKFVTKLITEKGILDSNKKSIKRIIKG